MTASTPPGPQPALRPIVAILRGITPPEAVAVGQALVGAGISRIEVPLNSPGAFDSIAALIAALPDAQIGAGTVLEVAQVARLAQMGARLIVSPNCDPAVIAATRAAGMDSLPGVMTPTEAFAALRAGASALKLFPGELVGPIGLRAMRAVLPAGTLCYAVGGVSDETLPAWRAAGADGIGVGSALFRPGDAADVVAQRATRLIAAWEAAG